MTFTESVQVAQGVVMTGMGLLLWSARGLFRGGEISASLHLRLDELEKRVDQAGEKMSTLATEVQGLPERLRAVFISRDEALLMRDESRRDRENLWAAQRRERERKRETP